MAGRRTQEEIDREVEEFRAQTLVKAGGREKVRREALPELKEEYKAYGKIYIRWLSYVVRIAFTFDEWISMYIGYFPDAPDTQISRFD